MSAHFPWFSIQLNSQLHGVDFVVIEILWVLPHPRCPYFYLFGGISSAMMELSVVFHLHPKTYCRKLDKRINVFLINLSHSSGY
jgi:hypothetical protein